MADKPDVLGAGVITNAALDEAYEFLAQALQQRGLRCTAAFVTAFAAGREALHGQLPLLEALDRQAPGWLTHVLARLKSGRREQIDGLDGNIPFEKMRIAGHEMAWHGATHLPLVDATPAAAVKLEVELAEALFGAMGARPTTIVFPRNRVGSLDLLGAAGFTCYRSGREANAFSRATGLLREMNIWDRGSDELPALSGEWCVCPAGAFLNWPSGARAAVPLAITVKRWHSMLRAAADKGGHVHLWFHPHNLITAPPMKASLLQILDFVETLVKSGDMVNLTMGELASGCAGGIVNAN